MSDHDSNLRTPLPPTSTLFPYTTLFRSSAQQRGETRRRAAPRARSTPPRPPARKSTRGDRKSTRLNSSHEWISYAVFCLKKKTYKKEKAAALDCHLWGESQSLATLDRLT